MYSFPNGDKASHLLLYGTLTLLVDLALFHLLPRRDPVRLTYAAGSVIAVIVSFEELSQLLFSSRNADWKDLLASCIGVVFFSILALVAYQLLPPEESNTKRDALAPWRN
jgi:VanZ family protein